MDKKVDKQQLRREARRPWAIGGGIAIVAVTVVAAALSLGGKSVAASDLRMAQADCGNLDIMVPASGRVVAAVEEIIISPVSTRIVKLFAQSGDTVAVGSPLLALDLTDQQTAHEKTLDRHRMQGSQLKQLRLSNSTMLSDLSMQLDVKEMQVNALQTDLDNERRLDSLGSGTGDRVRQAETALKVARLELRQLRAKLANERLRARAAEQSEQLAVSTIEKDLALSRRTLEQGRIAAPIGGVLTYMRTDVGAQIGAGERVAVVSDLSKFRIQAEVAEGSSSRVAVGARVQVRMSGTSLTGTVTNITPQARGGLVTFAVRLDQPSHKALKPGLSAELYVAYGSKTSVVRLPRGNYFKGPGKYWLFVADGAQTTLRLRSVTLGDSNDRWVEVESGLNAGERVVISDMSRFEGTKELKIKQP